MIKMKHMPSENNTARTGFWIGIGAGQRPKQKTIKTPQVISFPYKKKYTKPPEKNRHKAQRTTI